MESKRRQKHKIYHCGRCGLPKKGHKCVVKSTPDESSPISSTPADASESSFPKFAKRSQSTRQPHLNLCRALSFKDAAGDVSSGSPKSEDEEDKLELGDQTVDLDWGGLLAQNLLGILKRLPLTGLLAAEKVCKAWKVTARGLWSSRKELTLEVPAKADVSQVELVLKKCPQLTKLSLTMKSVVDWEWLGCIAISCPNLEVVEILISDAAINRITGDKLGNFVFLLKDLKSLRIQGCSSLGGLVLHSSSLSTLWLSDLWSLSETVFKCPNLEEIILEFSCQENDSTNLTAMVEGLGWNCQKLRRIYISSDCLSHFDVLALGAAELRCLQMLSLVLGSEIIDASVMSIASSYPELILLDLSGSSITDTGIDVICKSFHKTLSQLRLALCHHISTRGIRNATSDLPLLELLDCGMTCPDRSSQMSNTESEITFQNLIIQHARLKKLSLWGSGLESLYLNCPALNDLNLNFSEKLRPDKLKLGCPALERVEVSGCEKLLIEAIKRQVSTADRIEFHELQ